MRADLLFVCNPCRKKNYHNKLAPSVFTNYFPSRGWETRWFPHSLSPRRGCAPAPAFPPGPAARPPSRLLSPRARGGGSGMEAMERGTASLWPPAAPSGVFRSEVLFFFFSKTTRVIQVKIGEREKKKVNSYAVYKVAQNSHQASAKPGPARCPSEEQVGATSPNLWPEWGEFSPPGLGWCPRRAVCSQPRSAPRPNPAPPQLRHTRGFTWPSSERCPATQK